MIFDLFYSEKGKVSKPSGIPVLNVWKKNYSFCEPCFLGLPKI